MNTKHIAGLIGSCMAFLIMSCSNGSDEGIDNLGKEIDIKQAFLTDFPFEEADYLNIDITQPTVANNRQVKAGEIVVTLPYTVTSLALRLKSVNVDSDDFNVFPSIGTRYLFSKTDWTIYEVRAKKHLDIKVEYKVKVAVEDAPAPEVLSLADFKNLDKDTNVYTKIDRITKSNIHVADSLLYILFPDPIDFQSLTPVISFKGSKIAYRINGGEYEVYPVDTGTKIDFTYPNKVDFKISNLTETKTIVYRVMADVRNPIELNQEEVILPEQSVPSGDGAVNTSVFFTKAGTWTNIGNHPISGMGTNDYEAVTNPISDNDIRLLSIRLSSQGTVKVNPGEQGNVEVDMRILANMPHGECSATAVFNYTFDTHTWKIGSLPADDYNEAVFQPLKVRVKGSYTD